MKSAGSRSILAVKRVNSKSVRQQSRPIGYFPSKKICHKIIGIRTNTRPKTLAHVSFGWYYLDNVMKKSFDPQIAINCTLMMREQAFEESFKGKTCVMIAHRLMIYKILLLSILGLSLSFARTSGKFATLRVTIHQTTSPYKIWII